MTLSASDWLVVAIYLGVSAVIGLVFTRRAGRSLADYFVSGRSLPWWLAGTLMVSTRFTADAPLVVAGLVAKYGVAGNWLWWSGALSGILTVFFFARLWRRAGVVTDVEFIELRYGGRAAAILRGFRAFYLALPINLIIIAWVTRAMVTILGIAVPIEPWPAALILFGLAAFYTTVSGLWGVVVTHAFQFAVAMAGSILLAVFAVKASGGLDTLVAQSSAHFGSYEAAFGVLPPTDQSWMPLTTLAAFLAVQWWGTWVPGAEPGGGGYLVQRILATRDERHGLLATLWFNVAHYALRPWPWILVGLVAVLRYPDLPNPEEGYVRVMVDVLPSPLKGLLLAALAASYMSTVSTHLNWGASYLVNDVYLRFIRPHARPRDQVRASRIATGITIALALVALEFLTSVEQGWKLLIGLGAGTGLVLVLRWYWWRINAWSEISAMAASFVFSIALQAIGFNSGDTSSPDYAIAMLITVVATTIVWITITMLTPPETDATLMKFYKQVRPGGSGWRTVAKWAGFKEDEIPGGALSWVNWIAGVLSVYCIVFAIGAWLTGRPLQGWVYAAVAVLAFLLIQRNLRRDQAFMSGVDTPSPNA